MFECAAKTLPAYVILYDIQQSERASLKCKSAGLLNLLEEFLGLMFEVDYASLRIETENWVNLSYTSSIFTLCFPV